MTSECQTLWIQIRPDLLSGLIWVQTVCKGYQQITPVGNRLITLDKHGIQITIFLQRNTYCGYLLEASHRYASLPLSTAIIFNSPENVVLKG